MKCLKKEKIKPVIVDSYCIEIFSFKLAKMMKVLLHISYSNCQLVLDTLTVCLPSKVDSRFSLVIS